MDREIPQEEINRQRRRRLTIVIACVCVLVLLVWLLSTAFGASVKRSGLSIGLTTMGSIETTVNATGKVVPLFEEIINAPISTRILEVYCKAGDSVSTGTPLLRLDLENAETELRRLGNERDIQQVDKEKLEAANHTALANLEMQLKVKEMSVEKLREDVINEQRLDSIGSGTGERIRTAQLAYNTALLELEQLRTQLANEHLMQAAAMKVHDLNMSIAAGNISQMQRTLDDARLKSPRAATLTYIINEIGRRVNEGEKLAVVSDLHHFKVNGEIPDAHVQKFGTGSQAIVKIGKEQIGGTITNVIPQSQGGMISFTVSLDDDDNKVLRSGQSAQVYIVTEIVEEAMRIPNGSYYIGPGLYKMFVVTDDNMLQRRQVGLGRSNYDYVEVLSGLKLGDRVVISDMKDFQEKNKLKLK